MAIPDFQTIMLPLLRDLSDGQEKSSQDTISALAKEFTLSEQERKELLPSGQEPIFKNRVGWAKSYLGKAALIASPRRGYWSITQRGIDVLSKNPPKIDNRFLMQFPEFVAFKKPIKAEPELKDSGDDRTPADHLEYGYQEIRRELSDEILRRIKECSPDFFENLVVELLLKMGYGGSRHDAGRSIGRSGDGGIDGIIKEDKLGLDTIYIQAKRWEGVVGRPEVQKFAGALQGQNAKKGIFITTSDFTKDAQDYVEKIENRIVLVNGALLAESMIDHDVGVAKVTSYEIKRIDSDYFTSE